MLKELEVHEVTSVYGLLHHYLTEHGAACPVIELVN
jgi:hypothetical protein